MGLDTSRVLRIGVVYRGQVVAERVLDRRMDITVGTRPDVTIQVSAKDYPDFPALIPVALVHNNAYHVVMPADPTHGVSLRGGPAGGLDAVKGQIVQVKGQKAVPAEAFTGGSLSMGDIILMFQFVRGDAVPTVTHEETVLRIGLVHEDRLISDQVFHAGKPVSIGSNHKDTVVLPDIDYKGPSAVFTSDKRGTKFKVHLPKDCQLRLAIDGLPMDLAEATAKKITTQTADGVDFELPLKSRARASLGPYTLLFQVVRQSVTVPAMPRKSLAAQVFGPLMNDSAWSISFAVSFLLVVSLVAQSRLYYEKHEKFMEKARAAEEQAAAIYEVEIIEKEEIKEEEKKPVVDIMSDKAKEAQKEEVKKDEEKKAKKTDVADKPDKVQAQGKQADPEEKARQARAAVEQKTVAGAFKGMGASKMFADSGDSEGGDVVAKTFGGSGPGDGTEGAGGPGSGGVKLSGSNAGGGTMEKVAAGKPGGFGAREAAAVKDEGKKKEEATVQVRLSSGGMDGPGENKAEVGKVVSRKNSAVQRCYEEALRDNPDEGGKVKVTFTVGTEGTVTDVSVSGASGKFSDCIKARFSAIRGLPLLASPQTFSQSYVFSKGS